LRPRKNPQAESVQRATAVEVGSGASEALAFRTPQVNRRKPAKDNQFSSERSTPTPNLGLFEIIKERVVKGKIFE
jgi:hypothetical protein